MTRFLLALPALAIIFAALAAALAAAASTASAQPPVCVSLAPGEHRIEAPAKDRDGVVVFQLTVAEGGLVTAFTEPGGQSVPPATLLELFAGPDAYELPEGVGLIECGADTMMENDAMEEADAMDGATCINLGPGSHEGTVSGGGRSYDIVVEVSDDHEILGVSIRGQTYSATAALELLEGFGVAMPEGMKIVPCHSHDDSMEDDSMEDDSGMMEDDDSMMDGGYPVTGSGGLTDSASASSTALWSSLAALAAFALALTAAVSRRRLAVRSRE